MTESTIQPVYAILGATGGIGAALCRRLAASGARLAIGARDEAKLAALAAELSATTQVADATQAGQVDAFIARAAAAHGRLDGVVNCVGSLLLKPAHITTDDEWDFTLRQNLHSAFYLLLCARVVWEKRARSNNRLGSRNLRADQCFSSFGIAPGVFSFSFSASTLKRL